MIVWGVGSRIEVVFDEANIEFRECEFLFEHSSPANNESLRGHSTCTNISPSGSLVELLVPADLMLIWLVASQIRSFVSLDQIYATQRRSQPAQARALSMISSDCYLRLLQKYTGHKSGTAKSLLAATL